MAERTEWKAGDEETWRNREMHWVVRVVGREKSPDGATKYVRVDSEQNGPQRMKHSVFNGIFEPVHAPPQFDRYRTDFKPKLTHELMLQFETTKQLLDDVCADYMRAAGISTVRFDGFDSFECDDTGIEFTYSEYCMGSYDHDGGKVPIDFIFDRAAWQERVAMETLEFEAKKMRDERVAMARREVARREKTGAFDDEFLTWLRDVKRLTPEALKLSLIQELAKEWAQAGWPEDLPREESVAA